MSYTTTYRQYIQNVNHNDLSGINGSRYISFDIESGHLIWSGNTETVDYTPTTKMQLKGKSSNTRW